MILRYRKSMITTFQTVPYSYKNTQSGRFKALSQTTHGGAGGGALLFEHLLQYNLDLYYLYSRTSDKLGPRNFQVLLDTENNFTSGADHARCCLQPQNLIFSMLNKFNFKFFEQIYFFNNLFWEIGSKLLLEGNLQSSSRSTKKPLGQTISDAVLKFKNFNFSF